MNSKTAEIEKRLAELDEQIRDAIKRQPAHSPKPATVAILIDLEDERDALLKELETLKKKSCSA